MLQAITNNAKFLLKSHSQTCSNHSQSKLTSFLNHAPYIFNILLKKTLKQMLTQIVLLTHFSAAISWSLHSGQTGTGIFAVFLPFSSFSNIVCIAVGGLL